ncbi:hypothetical protein SEVIR_5G020000v4 [Setaria viridis]|uniref:Late embryogenesis abundant protein Lea5 n=2 Tax=Setaria TaxID=4554 RepID=K3XNL8_SETIT|nr:late embryogenesis abundant protein Lea5-D [Setaria italica]XP_034593776.1 late embryogenesis abundant protein Lea5-D-like [Setaria viridis]RCV23618.1 hypothetical protein SETIT_5G021400v2 [Setaria italica]TKW12176.1 hypothetical protein SEVIR_5G020000v2 [Setaria viridis]
MERIASSFAAGLLFSQRRGYSVAAAVVKGPGRKAVEKVAKRVMGKKEVNTTAASPENTPWVPDPVTGYYRPAGGTMEVDAAELRAMLLPQRVAIAS